MDAGSPRPFLPYETHDFRPAQRLQAGIGNKLIRLGN
jgi:hypothetical protein